MDMEDRDMETGMSRGMGMGMDTVIMNVTRVKAMWPQHRGHGGRRISIPLRRNQNSIWIGCEGEGEGVREKCRRVGTLAQKPAPPAPCAQMVAYNTPSCTGRR